MLKRSILFSALMLPSVVLAQGDATEKGAVNLWAASGWSFGLPANRAVIAVPGVGTAISPEKKTLAAPNFGLSVRAWRYLVPFFDMGVYDAGKATASGGGYKAQIEGKIFTFNGGLRVMPTRSKFRPYAEFGGGRVYQKPKVTFTDPRGVTTTSNEGGGMGSFMYGGGIQTFVGRRWGVDVGFDGFHVTHELAQGGSNFTRVRVGFFFQTKSRLP